MGSQKTNKAVYMVVRDALREDVHDVVYRAVEGAVYWSVCQVVWLAVYNAENANEAVIEAVSREIPAIPPSKTSGLNSGRAT